MHVLYPNYGQMIMFIFLIAFTVKCYNMKECSQLQNGDVLDGVEMSKPVKVNMDQVRITYIFQILLYSLFI